MGLANVRTALAHALDSIDGLRSYDFLVDKPEFSPTVAAAVVLMPDTIDVQTVLGGGSWTYEIPIRLFIGRGTDRSSDDLLEVLLESTEGIVSALRDDPTLGDTCESSDVISATDFNIVTVADVEALTCLVHVQVFGL